MWLFNKKKTFYEKGQIDKIEFYSTIIYQDTVAYNEYHLLIYSNQTTIDLLNIKNTKELFTQQEMIIFNQCMNNHINSWKNMSY